MITYDTTIDADVLDSLVELMVQMPQTIQTVVNRRVRPEVEQLIIRRLSVEPGKPQYPIRWKSQKQRRYVMRKLRKEGNLPYRRTGQLQKAWVVETKSLEQGAGITIRNTSPIATYVVGNDQQPFHTDTGWVKTSNELPAIQTEVTELFIDAYFDVIENAFEKGSRFA